MSLLPNLGEEEKSSLSLPFLVFSSKIAFMLYAICEIAGRQYLVKPGQTLEVDKLANDGKSVSVEKVLLMAEKGDIKIGTPYLKEVLKFEVLGDKKLEKVRVATFHAKANYRRVKGQRREVTLLKLEGEKITKTEIKKA